MTKLLDKFELEQIASLHEKKQFADCLVLLDMHEKKGFIHTGWTLWLKSICLWMTERPFQAISTVNLAIQHDPNNYNYYLTLDTISESIRDILVFTLREKLDLLDVRRIHQELLDSGVMTSAHQFLLARAYKFHGAYSEAASLIEAYLLLNPNNQNAIALKTDIMACHSTLTS